MYAVNINKLFCRKSDTTNCTKHDFRGRQGYDIQETEPTVGRNYLVIIKNSKCPSTQRM